MYSVIYADISFTKIKQANFKLCENLIKIIRDKSQVTQVNNLKIIWLNLKLDGNLIVNTSFIPVAAVADLYDTMRFFGLYTVDLG